MGDQWVNPRDNAKFKIRSTARTTRNITRIMEHKSDNDYDHDNRYETDDEHADETDYNNKKQITSVWGNLGGSRGGP